MLTKILRTIIGLPFVLVRYTIMIVLIIIMLPIVYMAAWVGGELDKYDFRGMPDADITGISPVAFIKKIWSKP